MQLKKRIVTMLAGIALLAFGVFTACDTATNPEKENENQNHGGNDSSFIKVETTNEGIKFSYDEIPENISDLLIELVQKDKKSLTELRINSLTTNYLIDKYVDANTEYDCYISWKNADGTSDRIEPLSVKTTAGLGEVRLSNQPAASFDSQSNTVTFTTLPEFSGVSNLDWGCNFGYRLKGSKNEKWDCLYNGISKNDTNVIRTIYDDVEFGTWNRCNYIVWFDCGGFEYKHFEWDELSKIENMPETINLVDNKPRLIATPVDEGIKFEWKNIPENSSNWSVILEDKKSITELMLSSLTVSPITDKYVSPNTEYRCYIQWKNADGNWESSRNISVTPTNGLGEAKITNQPAASFDSKNNTVTFTTLPEFSGVSNLDWVCGFGYRLKESESGKWEGLYFIDKNDTELIYTISGNREFGTWNLCNYIIYFDCEGFDYKHYEYNDISMLTNIPQTINLVDDKPKLIATPVDEGIKFEWKNIPEGSSNWYVELYKKDGKSSTELHLSSISVTSIIDKYVDANSEYGCYIGWKNADDTWNTSKTISVTSKNGLGEVRMTNEPAASFDSKNNTVTFTTLPEFSGNSTLDWWFNFGYHLKDSESGNWNYLYNGISKNDTNLTRIIYDDVEFGTWNICKYVVSFDCDGFQYAHFEYDDISKFTNIPQTISLVDNKPKLIATPIDEGIKFEWKNIPEGCSNWYVRLNKKDKESLTELKLSSMSATSIIDKYVDANSEYSCYIRWENSDGTWDSSKTISVTPTNGLGEAKITNQPAASFDSQNKTVIFETLPEFSALQDINWRCVFGYKLKETGDWDWIYNAIYKNNSNKIYSIFDETASGNWILCDYIVSFNDDDFEYKHYEDDISMLSGIPKSISF